MGRTLNKICDTEYSSIVVVMHKREGCCQVIGGCTFRVHIKEKFIELLLLGVKSIYQRNCGIGTRIMSAL